MGVAVGSQTCQDSPVHQFHGGRASAGIAHVGFRIMYDHGVGILHQVHLMGIDVNAVSQQRLLSQDIPVHEPVHDPLAVLLQAVMEILDSLCHVDMIAYLVRLVGRRQLHSLV